MRFSLISLHSNLVRSTSIPAVSTGCVGRARAYKRIACRRRHRCAVQACAGAQRGRQAAADSLPHARCVTRSISNSPTIAVRAMADNVRRGLAGLRPRGRRCRTRNREAGRPLRVFLKGLRSCRGAPRGRPLAAPQGRPQRSPLQFRPFGMTQASHSSGTGKYISAEACLERTEAKRPLFVRFKC
jgi:hypothetical protein